MKTYRAPEIRAMIRKRYPTTRGAWVVLDEVRDATGHSGSGSAGRMKTFAEKLRRLKVEDDDGEDAELA